MEFDDIEQASSLTIEEVVNVKTGETLKSRNILSLPFDQLNDIKKELQSAVDTGKPFLVCSHCNQMLTIRGRSYNNSRIEYFAHLMNSQECDIKTDEHIPKKLTVKRLLNTETGEITEAEDILNKNEGELFNIRRSIETNTLWGMNKYCCSSCLQNVRLSGRKKGQRLIYFFAHFAGSGYCIEKSPNRYSNEYYNANQLMQQGKSAIIKDMRLSISEALLDEKVKH